VTASPILIADDSPTNVFVLVAMLRSFGHACRVASDGAEAVAMAEAEPPTLILMDINMPKLSGIEAARRIRARRAGPPVAIVAVTAHPDSRHLAAFKEAGFDALMLKPVELGALREIVARFLGPGRSPGPSLAR
jgi:CheY-like chemotaxis protein